MIVATDVMRIGRSRMRPASSTAETVSSPRAFSWLVYSTSRIEFLLTKPISKIMPISLYRLIVAPDRCRIAASFSVASAPVMASGTASSTVQGCTSDSNCDASTMNTTSSATPNAKYNAPALSRNSRDSPARAVVVPGGNTWRALIFGTIAIERDPQLRLVHDEIGLHVREAFDLRGATHERSHDFRELREIRILHHVLDRLRKADRSWSVRERHDAGDAHELGEQPADHLLDGRMALAKVHEDGADERAVNPSGEPAHDREVAVDVGGPTDDLLDLSHVAIGVWERRTLRTTHNNEEKPTIVVGDQLVLQASRRDRKSVV